MDSKDEFLSNSDFDNLRKVKNLEVLTLNLINLFEEEGFQFYPEWRGIDKSGRYRKNFTFKAKQLTGRIENIITIYPMTGWLKVEVYRGEYDKTPYPINIDNINDIVKMRPLLDDAKDIYNSISTFKI